MSGPIFGLCPGSRDWMKETGNPLTGKDWIRAPPAAPKHLDDTDNVMRHLALKKIDAFSGIGHGFYFWNFRTDLYEPQWSYMAAIDRGWIPNGNLNDDAVKNACMREDAGDFQCVLKRNQIDKAVHDAMAYAYNVQGLSDTPEAQAALNLTGDALQDAASQVIDDYWQNNRHSGATCDFGGVAMLIEQNRTLTDDDSIGIDDDEYYTIVYGGPPIWLLVIAGIGVGLVGAVLGFVIAMKKNPEFNRRVRNSSFFMPISKSQNKLIRSSLNLPDLVNYDELEHLVEQQKMGH